MSSGTRASRVVNDSYSAAGSPAGKIGPAAPVEEQGVAGDKPAVDQEALAARRVPGVWTRVMGTAPTVTTSPPRWVDQFVGADTGGAGDPGGLVRLDVHGHRRHLEQTGDPLDAPPHHVAADVVGVEVGGQGTDAFHPVGLEDPEELVHAVGGVDDDRLTGLPSPIR